MGLEETKKPEEYSREFYLEGKLYLREGALEPWERKNLPCYEKFKIGQTTVEIFRGLGSTTIHETNPPRKLRFPGYEEVEVSDFDGTTIIPVKTTPEQDEEIFRILDERAREDLANSYRLV